MISLSAEQGDVLFLCKDNAVAGNHLTSLEQVMEKPITTLSSWDELFEVASQKPVALLAFQIGVIATQSELEKLRAFVELQPACLRIAFQAGPIFFKRLAYGKCCYRILESSSDGNELIAAVEDGLRAQRVAKQAKVSSFMAKVAELPAVPDVYDTLCSELISAKCNATSLSAHIAGDKSLERALLDFVNDAYYIIQKNVTSLDDAIDILGHREAPDVVLFQKLFERYAQSSDWSSFAFEHIRNRSFLVAGLVKEICNSVKAPVEVAEQAYLAALLQDLGVLILAAQDPVGYQRVTQEASDLKQPLYVVEKLRLGVSHSEIVGYLTSKWHLSPAVTEAVLFHHFPKSCKSDQFTALSALHIADAILPEVISVLGNQISCHLNYAYLERLGLEGRINQWQKMAARFKPSHLGSDGMMCSFA